jgi:hypothetical protein
MEQRGCSQFTAAPQLGRDGRWYTWSIGILTGNSLRNLCSPGHISNPVISARDVSDVAAAFVADPFMVRKDGLWYMFLEVFNTSRNKGEIALATSRDGFAWDYCQVVLREPFHLSYPSIFAWNGEYYLLPETVEANAVRLYKAVSFPAEWKLYATLIEPEYSDPSIFRWNERWWMFACPAAAQVRDSSLALFSSDDLRGPWTEHMQSPVVEGNRLIARPAGRVWVDGGRVTRFAQDKANPSGNHVRAFQVLELTATSYRETEVAGGPVLGPGGSVWNRSGMHHIDLHRSEAGGYIACVDGVIRE